MKIEKHKIHIGIDVSTKNTGFASFVNGKLHIYGTIKSTSKLSFCGNKIRDDIVEINKNVLAYTSRLKETLEKLTGSNKYEIDVIVILENSNHGIQSVGQKLSTYIGLYSQAIVGNINLLFGSKYTLELKLANPREWQLRCFGRVLERNEGKAESIDRALRIQKRDFEKSEITPISNDDADAINMASVAGVLRDNLLVGQEKRTRAKTQEKNKSAVLRTNIFLNNLFDNLRTKKILALEKELAKPKEKQKIDLIKNKNYIDFATTQQKLNIQRYEAILKENNASLDALAKFTILGKE